MTATPTNAALQTPSLLIVEDSNEDFEALQRFLRRSPLTVPLYRCKTGEEALAFLYQTGKYAHPNHAPRPGLILLDLNLPGTDGREVLRRIKQDDWLKVIPVVIFTTSNNPRDIEACYQQGANGYIVKPIDFSQLKRSIQAVLDFWFEIATLPHHFTSDPKDTEALVQMDSSEIGFDPRPSSLQVVLESCWQVGVQFHPQGGLAMS